jgi:hypothetical protein
VNQTKKERNKNKTKERKKKKKRKELIIQPTKQSRGHTNTLTVATVSKRLGRIVLPDLFIHRGLDL